MTETTTYRNALQLASMLLEYRLESVLGAGGFGMTYLGWDTHLEKHVAIKEYLPTDLAVRALDGSIVPITTEFKYNYQWGLERFILEARTLAKFSHPHIVRVNRYFETNGTGYMVMDYEKGESLNQMLKRGQLPDEAKLKGILMPLLDGLQAVHAAGFLHRDIKPSNIFVRESGSPVLIDFGASRQAVGGATKSLTSVLTPGYAPLEQYTGDGNQGPWSDIYAMAGVLYRALSQDNPPDAVSRMKADTVAGKLAMLRGRVSEPFLRAVEWALMLDEKQRPQSVDEWRRALQGATTAPVTSRPGAQSAPTVRPGVAVAPAATAAPAQSMPRTEPRRVTRPPQEPKSGWRWVGIGALALVVVFAASAWNKQRQAERRAAEQLAVEQRAAKQQEAERLAKERRAAERLRLEEREARAREAERRAMERETELRRADEERSRQRSAGAGPVDVREDHRPPPEAWRERPPRARDERPSPGDYDEPRRRAEADFRSADRNGDGYLNREEVVGRPLLVKEFHRIDTNGDGHVSPEEFMRFRKAMFQNFRK